MAMDPDRYQMRDLKRRISKIEDQIGYLKTDWKRTTMKLVHLIDDLERFLPEGFWISKPREEKK